MTHSETFLSAKFGGFHSPFTNDYLLKHGNFFMKPTIHPDGFMYPAISESARYQIFKDVKCEIPEPDLPLNFAIKQEKPPTPPASTSPTPLKSPSPSDATDSTQMINGHTKNATWILGKQKLSWDNSTVASYNPDTKMFRCVVCNAVGFLSRIAEHYLGTHTSAKVFQCLHCPYSSTWSRCVRMHMAKHHGVPNAPPSLWKGQPLLKEIFQLLTNLKTTVDSQGRERLDPELCDKKADHVKKHFLRIHRGHPYDISLVRRRPPRAPAVSGNNNTANNNGHAKPVSNNFTVDKLISNDNEKSGNDAIDLSRRDSPPSDSNSTSGKQMKTFQCPYCEWEGVDSWCLRRHMNVHMKSFECPCCEFKVAKPERLFSHVFRAHKKLICTKCKFITELAQDFEVHIKDCCLEMVNSDVFDKVLEDSPDESDMASPELKFESLNNGTSEVTPVAPFSLADVTKMFDARMPLDLKGSVSLMPLHNSISYCYPAPQGFRAQNLNGLTNTLSDVMMNGDGKPATTSQCKMDVKAELASPIQSSSDSGVADITSDNVDQEFVCFHCGCEFANGSSLETHTELYHREDTNEKDTTKKNSSEPPPPPPNKTKKFSCAICNFNSDKQRTIIEHMRFHTGEVLHCQAGPPCAFKTVCDSILEKHVESEHSDILKRCPHCGFHCTAKIPFIRHYRKCHH
ncbi:protein charlatan [Caerostris extrusa]|uniref:Protein charlatan n=1 Tax=Caerostris extrusa TaxID=172846 RepID=A0AAV4XKI6_CAEEX|nr:protein charlatan [Caerostris extrusa]